MNRRFTETYVKGARCPGCIQQCLSFCQGCAQRLLDDARQFPLQQLDAKVGYSLYGNDRNAAVQGVSFQHVVQVPVSMHETITSTEKLGTIQVEIASCGQLDISGMQTLIPSQRSSVSALSVFPATDE